MLHLGYDDDDYTPAHWAWCRMKYGISGIFLLLGPNSSFPFTELTGETGSSSPHVSV